MGGLSKPSDHFGINWGTQKLMGKGLKFVWAEFSTLS
jgi:hypothetical protein